MTTPMTSASTLIRSLFHDSLRQINVGHAVEQAIKWSDSELIVFGQRYDLSEIDDVLVIAVGKAAAPMYEAVAATLDQRASAHSRVMALVVSPTAPEALQPNVSFVAGSHPVPNQTSKAAAAAVLDRLRLADGRTFVLFLISGGASSMLEAPLDLEISIGDTAEFYRGLVASGLPITEMNVLRKHFSCVKGGRLASAAARAAAQCTLIVSDVPRHTVESVGSGPSLPDSSTVADTLRILKSLEERVRVPKSIVSFFRGPLLQETPKLDDPIFARSFHRVILSSDDLAEAAAQLAQAAGFHVELDSMCDEWECGDAARYLLERMAALARIHPRTCLISVGEISVRINGRSGRGGRNQHFALSCAIELARERSPITVLSAGSDGVDGNSPAAGAVADWTTCARARERNIDAQRCLDTFDSFSLFDALGDTIVTGPTGNNVRDLRILLSSER